jgi:hypothetical protein
MRLGVAEIFWGLWLFPLALLFYRSRFLSAVLDRHVHTTGTPPG